MPMLPATTYMAVISVNVNLDLVEMELIALVSNYVVLLSFVFIIVLHDSYLIIYYIFSI